MAYAPEWLAFEELFGYRPKVEGDIDCIFRQWDQIGQDSVQRLKFPPPDESVQREEHVVPKTGNKVRVYRLPGSNVTGTSPACVYIHGGGWTLGNLDLEDSQCAEICKRTSCTVIALSYRLAPKHQYPIPLDDCVAGYEWVRENSGRLGISASDIVLAGGSAGANLAIATALKVLDRGGQIPPKGLLALAPVTIDPRAVPAHLKDRYTSYEDNKDTGPNTPSGMRGFIDAYGPEPQDIYFSVLLHPRLSRLPRTYIALCGKDTLRDDGTLFAEALQKAGVPVRTKEYHGFPHYFWTWPAPSLLKITAEFQDDCRQALEWLQS